MGFSEADVISALKKVFATVDPRILVGIGDDAAVVFVDFLDGGQDAVLLEIVEHVPDGGAFEIQRVLLEARDALVELVAEKLVQGEVV